MTEYVLTDFRDVAKGNFRRFQRAFDTYRKPMRLLRNGLTSSELRIEGDAGGFLSLGADFLLAAAQRSHLHVYSGTAPGHLVGPFTEGLNGSIGDMNDPRAPDRIPGVAEFRYKANPVATSGFGILQSGSLARVDADEEWGITGNTPALISFAERCFDLAEDATRVPVELIFESGTQLEKDSLRLVLVRRQ